MERTLITQTEGGQRRYWIDGEYQRYMSAREVKAVLRKEGFSGSPGCATIFRKFERKNPLEEVNVEFINNYLRDKHSRGK